MKTVLVGAFLLLSACGGKEGLELPTCGLPGQECCNDASNLCEQGSTCVPQNCAPRMTCKDGKFNAELTFRPYLLCVPNGD